MIADREGGNSQDGGGMFGRHGTILPGDVLDLIHLLPHSDGNGGSGEGTEGDDNPDDPPVLPANPPRRSQTPEQKFSRADLDNAASTARGEERARVQGKHERDIQKKDEQIESLKVTVAGLEETISGFDKDTRDEFETIKPTLPEWLKPFAPEDDAPVSEIRSFLTKMRKSTSMQEEATPDPVPLPAPPLGYTPPPAPGNPAPTGPTVNEEIAERRRTAGKRF